MNKSHNVILKKLHMHPHHLIIITCIFQEEEPLASLPLIGYAVTRPDEVSRYKHYVFFVYN